MKRNLVRVFFSSDMRCSHKGLKLICEENNFSPSENELVVFVNRKQTMFKLLSGPDTVGFYKSPSGRVTMDAIQYLPEAFNGHRINFNSAIKRALFQKGINPIVT